jgi:hypothetical protein
MRITIDTGKTIQSLETIWIRVINFIYGWWVKEAEAIGYIVGVIHILFASVIFILIILSHTVYNEFWLQCVVFVCLTLVVIQHIVLKVCIMTVAEENLTHQKALFLDVLDSYLSVVNITTDQFMIYFVLSESVAACFLGLELISRTCVYLRRAGY